MILRKSMVIFSLVLSLAFTACIQLAKEISDWTKVDDIEAVEGQQFLLSDDGIKIYLPTSFEEYSAVKYLTLLDTLVTDNKALEMERSRLRHLRNMEGNYYIYFDNSVNATYTIKTMEYLPISRQDARFILGIMRQEQDKYAQENGLTYEKITAKHNDNGRAQVFKAIFRVDNKKLEHKIFQHIYAVSSNKKTVLISLTAPFEIYFDPFLEKMIL